MRWFSSKTQRAFQFVCDCDFKNLKNTQNFTTFYFTCSRSSAWFNAMIPHDMRTAHKMINWYNDPMMMMMMMMMMMVVVMMMMIIIIIIIIMMTTPTPTMMMLNNKWFSKFEPQINNRKQPVTAQAPCKLCAKGGGVGAGIFNCLVVLRRNARLKEQTLIHEWYTGWLLIKAPQRIYIYIDV